MGIEDIRFNENNKSVYLWISKQLDNFKGLTKHYRRRRNANDNEKERNANP